MSISLLAFVDFAVGPLMRWIGPNDPAAAIVYMCFGAIGAQAGLHSVWCVLAPVGPVKRLATGVGTALLFLVAGALAYLVNASEYSFRYSHYWEDIRVASLSLPLVALAVQLPLWAARIWCRWHVVHVADPPGQSTYKALGIRDILVATGVVAMALSAAQLATPDGVSNGAAVLLPLLTVAGAAAAISLFTTLPVVAATLHASRPWRAIICVLLLQVMILLGILSIVALFDVFRTKGGVSLTFVAIGFVACLNGVMMAARALGYRLLWGRQGMLDNRNSVDDNEESGRSRDSGYHHTNIV
ncbi:MAG: hypothetical protein V3R99_12160 [Thermoguttaceae bacterium]